MNINLVMFNSNKYGGPVTFTAHLYHALRGAGHNVMIYRLGKGRPGKPKDFGYGALCRTGSAESILSEPGHKLVTACIGKEHEAPTRLLFDNGARLLIHDPNDLGNFKDLSFTDSDCIVTGRPVNLRLVPNATVIPYPFVRSLKGFRFYLPRTRHAVTLSRLGAIKRTRWVLDANRLLSPEKSVWLRGYDDRFFTFNAFVRNGKYPEFRQDSELPEGDRKTFVKEMGAAQAIASTARFLVDLTHIKGDGGGNQYAFMEGADAGCVLVLNRAWLLPNGMWEEGRNCLAVASGEELAEVLSRDYPLVRLRDMARGAYDNLRHHNPAAVAAAYEDFLQRTALR